MSCRLLFQLKGAILFHQLIYREFLHQIQLQHDRAQSQFWVRVAEHDKDLEVLSADMSEDGQVLYHETAARYVAEQTSMQKDLQAMVKTVTKMLSEYNKIMINKETFIHIAQAMEFRMAVMASVTMHVTDASIRSKIGNDIRLLAKDHLRGVQDA